MDTWKNTEADGYPPMRKRVRLRFMDVERTGYTVEGRNGPVEWRVRIGGTDYPAHAKAVTQYRELTADELVDEAVANA